LLSFYQPGGSLGTTQTCSASLPGCELHLTNLPAAGTYTVTLAPSGQATMGFVATLSQDQIGTLSSGAAFAVNLATVGQSATLTFALASQQSVAIELGAISTNPVSTTLYAYVYNSSGTQVVSGSAVSGTALNLQNLAAGTYTVAVTPLYPVTGSAQVTFGPAVGGALTPITSGTGGSYNTHQPGQNAYFTFTATAGQSMTLAVTNVALSSGSISNINVVVYKPDTSTYSTQCFTPSQGSQGCELHLRNVPLTGTYSVTVSPGGSGQATMSFTLTLSQDASGTLNVATPLNLNLAAAGQSATLSFTLSSPQTVGLNLSSLSLNPAGVLVYVYVYSASGTDVGHGSTTTATTVNLPNQAAGTYSVLVMPYSPVTGSLQVTLEPGIGGLLTADGSSQNFSTPGIAQNAYFTFAATPARA
jgi:hypothetical protein